MKEPQKIKLVGGLKYNFYFTLLVFLSLVKFCYSSQILDYETEIFVNKLINDIKFVNKTNKKINFKIISDESINAFVDIRNTIFITSGLIEHCDDYVAFLSVLAHEIGHIDRNHVLLRKKTISKLSDYKNISTLSIIAGSMMSRNPLLIQSMALSSATASNIYLGFSKEQEIEADYYSLETITKLNVYSQSIINLLKRIEKKSLEKGLDREQQKLGTHPYFEDRIKTINLFNENKKIKFDKIYNDEYNFIKAKFLGYSNNKSMINNLNQPFKKYAEAIVKSIDGKLYEALSELNEVIIDNKQNISLLETKADILFSHGYTEEAVKFYEIVYFKQPSNNYAQIRIFENIKINNLTKNESETIFLENLNLLKAYYNNKNILVTYLKLSEKIENLEWINFLNFWLNKDSKKDFDTYKYLKNYENINDINLKDLINNIIKNYK